MEIANKTVVIEQTAGKKKEGAQKTTTKNWRKSKKNVHSRVSGVLLLFSRG